MSKGYTLIEVVVALLVFEVGILGVSLTFLLAASTLTRAETLERAVAGAEGVLDSLAAGARPGTGTYGDLAGSGEWSVDDSGYLVVTGSGPGGEVLLEVHSLVPLR